MILIKIIMINFKLILSLYKQLIHLCEGHQAFLFCKKEAKNQLYLKTA